MKGENIMLKRDDNTISIWRVVLLTIGIILFIATLAIVAYKFFKKHFKITLECGDCDFCDADCSFDDVDFEPECCIYDGCSDVLEDAAE